MKTKNTSGISREIKNEIAKHISHTENIDKTRVKYDKIEIKKDLRIKFIKNGFIYDPDIEYKLEIREKSIASLNFTINELLAFNIKAKVYIDEIKKRYTVYLSDYNSIIEFLKIIGASISLKTYIKSSVDKQTIGNINRKVNFETANIKRSVDCAIKQLDLINNVLAKYDISELSSSIQEIILLRLKYKDASLNDLSIISGISKNAINHRFLKLKEYL